jgi:WD40 repeat protein
MEKNTDETIDELKNGIPNTNVLSDSLIKIMSAMSACTPDDNVAVASASHSNYNRSNSNASTSTDDRLESPPIASRNKSILKNGNPMSNRMKNIRTPAPRQQSYNEDDDDDDDGDQNFFTPVNVFSEVIDMDTVEQNGIADARYPLDKPQLDRASSTASALGDFVAAAGSPWFNPKSNNAAVIDLNMLSDFEDDDSAQELEQGESVSSVGDTSHGSNNSSNGSMSVYHLKDMNTGKEYDIKDPEKNGSQEACFNIGVALFPTNEDLMQQIEKKKNEDNAMSKLSASMKRTGKGEEEGVDLSDSGEKSDGSAGMKGDGTDKRKTFFRRSRLDTGDTSIASAKGGKVSASANPKRRKEKKARGKPFPQPMNTVHTNRKHKKDSDCDFNPMLLISTIKGAHTGPIWCSSFSADGKYFATGGKDGVVKIWEVSPQLKKGAKEATFFDKIGSYWKGSASGSASGSAVKDEVEVQDDEQSEDEVADALGMEIIILNPKPLQTFQDHSKDVVDLSWSNTGYLVTGSLDKTARLWHPSRAMCLSIFTHPDAVVSVSFNPVEDQYFITGGFDKKLRIWNIPNGRVAKYLPTPGVITTVLYGPDGKTAAAGLIDGKVFFYEVTESADVNRVSLRYHTQITTKQKGKKTGKKVTGLAFLKNLSDDKIADVSDPINSPRNSKDKGRMSGLARKIASPMKRKKKIQQQLLITTNDSRLRLIGMSDFCMVRKYKGHQNTSLQIRARFSESGEFIISGSESKGACTIWNTATKRNPLNLNVTGLHMHDKVKAHEWFEAATGDTPIVTDACFVPRKCLKESMLSSGLFPTMISLDNINHDFSSAAIVACDYQGTMRIFLRRTCIDAVSYAAGPAGHSISVQPDF